MDEKKWFCLLFTMKTYFKGTWGKKATFSKFFVYHDIGVVKSLRFSSFSIINKPFRSSCLQLQVKQSISFFLCFRFPLLLIVQISSSLNKVKIFMVEYFSAWRLGWLKRWNERNGPPVLRFLFTPGKQIFSPFLHFLKQVIQLGWITFTLTTTRQVNLVWKY